MEARDPLVGTTVAERYRVLRLLGMGGMGAVYEVEHLLIGRRFALKTLHPEFARSGEAVLRFQREARAAAAIGDEHIIEVSDMGNLQDGSPFIVLELLDGEDLGHLLKKTGPMPLSRAIQLARQACDALEKAHLKGIVHRDIKPDNIFILQRKGSDFVKLLDFGISKVQESAIGMSAGGLTKTGMAIGTPYYMAPEQISGDRAIDARADVYAMGAVVFEMLMGCVPFDAATYPALVIKVVQEPPPSIRAFRADVPEDLEAVVLKALAKAPEARFASIREFGDALARFESLPSSPPRTAASSALASTATPKAWSVTSESIRVPKTGSPLRNGALATNDNLAAGSKSIATVEVIPARYRAALRDVGSHIRVRVVLTTTGSGSRDSNVFDYEVELQDTPCTKTAREVACNFDELDAGTQNDASNGQLDSSLTQSDASQDASGSHDGSKQIDDGGADGAMDGSSESCAATQGSAWALWPMPNAPGSGLPNTADYTDNGDGTVTDEVTGLMWRKAVETSLYWEETTWMCEDLVLGGHCDWRVPSRIELASLVDVSRTSPTIDTSAFPGTSVGYFWSSTPLLGSSSKAWAVSFALGLVREGNTGIGGGGDAFSLRCVRTERAGTQHAYQTDAATVTDASTSLTWQANLDAGSMDWNAASAYCSGLTTASGGWRLPSVKELLTLVDDAHGPPAIDTTFSGTPSTTFWSSSIDAADSNKAWMVDFAGGGSSTDSATVAHRVRCVR